MSHFRSIKREWNENMETTRSVEMAGLEGYLQILNYMGPMVNVMKISGILMKKVCVKFVKHLFEQ